MCSQSTDSGAFRRRQWGPVLARLALLVAVLVVAAPVVALAAAPVSLSDGQLRALQRETAPAGAVSTDFGTSVGIDGDTAVIGGYPTSTPGDVYVYERAGSTWRYVQSLAASDGQASDIFGSSVAISGNTIVVGAPQQDGMGAAYVFVKTDSGWQQQAELQRADRSSGNWFGCSVAISGDTVLVGSYGSSFYTGAAFTFVRSGTSWTQEATLTASSGRTFDYFGYSVALSGDRALVGADRASSAGRAYTFVRDASGWQQEATLTAPGSASGDQFGYSVALSGGSAVVGAPAHSAWTGAAYVYALGASGWSQEATLSADTPLADDEFGHAVAVSDGQIVVGATGRNGGGGSLISFLNGPGGWRRTGEVGSAPDTSFGVAAGISHGVALSAIYFGSATFIDMPYTVAEDMPLAVNADSGLLANDTDADGDTLMPSLVDTSALHGTMDVRPDGSFTYTPEADFNGTATATYRDFDGTGYSAPATITIAVTPVNDAPVAVDDGLIRVGQTFPTLAPAGTVDQYGMSSAIQGDTAVTTAGNGSLGAVYFYGKDVTGAWALRQRFALSDAANVVISGDTVVVGQRNDDTVTVFVRIGGVWTVQQTITDGNGTWGDEFGFQVALDGDTLVVGTPRYNRWKKVGTKSGYPPGSAYVYTRSGGVWTQAAELTASTESTLSDVFGSQVGIQGDTIMASGRYIGTWDFERTGANWSSYTQTKLALAHTSQLTDVGQGIAIDGDTAFVGASLDGAVNILKRTPTGWTQVQSLTGGGQYFGESVALQGDTAVVGYYDHPLLNLYLYHRAADGVWRQTAILPAADGWQMSVLGLNVSMSGTTVFAGDIYAQANTENGPWGASQFWDVNQYLTDEDTSMSLDATHSLLANDHDIEGDALTASLVDTSAIHGTIDLAPDGTFTYTPEKDFAGTATATYRAFDGIAYSAPATITITVAPVDDAPVAVNDTATCAQDSSTTIDVLANDTDIDTPHASLVATDLGTPAHGTVSLSATGSVIYAPEPGFQGTDAFTYKAFDGQQYSAPATVTVTVANPPNDFVDLEGDTIPVGGSLTTTFTVGVPATFTVSASGDPTPTVEWSGAALPSGLSATIDGEAGAVAGRAAPGSAGVYDLVLTATNAGGSAAITLHVVVIESHTITPVSGDHGRISPVAPVTVAWGDDSPTFQMLPDTGYHVSDVSIDGVSVGASSSVTLLDVTADHTIFATFSKTKPVFRIGGANRYQTSIAIARTMYPGFAGVRHVVLASGDSGHMPDALTGAGLASAYRGPLLLVPKKWLDTDVKAALLAMPKGVQVHVLGSSSAVSDSVLSKIKKLRTVKSVDRVAGADRFGTSAVIAKRIKKVMGRHFPTTALVTSGRDSWLFDPLIASNASAAKGFPVLLVKADSVPAATRSAMRSLGVRRTYLLGSPVAVNESVRASLKINPADRIFGSDVYGDSVAFAQRARAEGWLAGNTIGFAATLPDTASSGAFMGSRGAPIIVVGGTWVPAQVTGLLAQTHDSIEFGCAFGGVAALDEPTRAELERDINGMR